MAKYGPKAQEIIEKTMKDYGDGRLKSSNGNKVTDHKQAVAIGISQAKEAGTKVPKQP